MSDDRKSEVRGKKLTDDFEFHHEDAGKPSIIHVILLNRTLRILAALGVFCMLIPTLDYFYFYSSEMAEYEIDDSGTCSHYPIYQIPCGGEESITKSECTASACCFSPTSGCYHFLPSKYQLRAEEESLVPTRTHSPLGTKTFATMKLDIGGVSDEIALARSAKYDVKVFAPELFVEVRRKIDNRTLLSTARGALIASENYFEWSVHLGGDNIKLMGFDTTHLREGRRILINNAHSSVTPYVVAYDRQSKHYHAVHFESIDSPAELQMLKSNTIIIRQYSSAQFRMRVFVGPSYGDIYRQLRPPDGRRHYVPQSAFWPLGVHICATHSPYNETESGIELSHLLARSQAVPFDSHCIHSELTALIVSRTEDNNELDGAVEQLRSAKKKFLLHLTLGAVDADNAGNEHLHELALTNDDESLLVGLFGRTRRVFYLDFITKAPEIVKWLRKQFEQRLPLIDAHGIALHRNFPFDDAMNKSLAYIDNFRFVPHDRNDFERLIERLIPLNARLRNGEPLIRQLNNFGRAQIEALASSGALSGEKFCIADSYRETSGSCGMLMRVERASWTSLQSTLQKSVLYSLLGMTFHGAEVCGGEEAVAEDLCIRWYQFAIFAPLFYVDAQRVPSKFTRYAERIMVHVIRTRYALLAYMRTCLLSGEPLLRPLHLAYPQQLNDTDASHQLMFGDALMIAPITEPLVDEVSLHFPEAYFELWSGVQMPPLPRVAHFSIVMHDIPLFIRAGRIVALHLAHEATSAEEAAREPYLLVVALACSESYTCHARGRQQSARGVEFAFEASEAQLNVTVLLKEGEEEEARNAICGGEGERVASGEFRLAKIYGLGDFKERYRRNDYLSLDLNICDADWNGTFSISI